MYDKIGTPNYNDDKTNNDQNFLCFGYFSAVIIIEIHFFYLVTFGFKYYRTFVLLLPFDLEELHNILEGLSSLF